MATQWCLLRGGKDAAASKSPQHSRAQGMGGSIKQSENDPDDVDFWHLHQNFHHEGRRQGFIMRGYLGYCEDQIDYCSSDPAFQSVYDGLAKRPSWERLSFAVLLKLWYKFTPKQRHNHASYAFKSNGNPTLEYRGPLLTYARSRTHLIKQYQDERRIALQERVRRQRHAEELLELIETDSGYGSDSQTDTNMHHITLPLADLQEHTPDSMPDAEMQEDGAESRTTSEWTTTDPGNVFESLDERPVARECQARRIEAQVKIMIGSKIRQRLAARTQEIVNTRPGVRSISSTKNSKRRVFTHQHRLVPNSQAVSKARSRLTRLEEEADLQDLCEQRRQRGRERALSVDSERGGQG